MCSVCGDDIKLVNCDDRSDGFKWECRRRINSKRHKVELSIRAGSWFEQSKMTLEEILKYSNWWCQELDQAQIRHELGLATHTGVDWDSFCREVCEISGLEIATHWSPMWPKIEHWRLNFQSWSPAGDSCFVR